jgi:hypothetical protein
MRMINNKFWIPGRTVELPLRLIVEAHRCPQDTDRTKRSWGKSKSMFTLSTIAKDVKVFLQI